MSSNLESKIAEMILGCDDVKEKKCELLKDLNTPHTEKENRKICASCRAKAILALIAEEQKPLVEALEKIRSGEGSYNRDPFKHLENCYDNMIEIARAALKGVGR